MTYEEKYYYTTEEILLFFGESYHIREIMGLSEKLVIQKR